MTDIFLYNGPMSRGSGLQFIRYVSENKKSDECKIIMTSLGGSSSVAYKMARYLQENYKSFSILVPSLCKSAATLFAIGAKEIVFFSGGELGPLDVQLQKEDQIFNYESGLNIQEGLDSLEERAKKTYHDMIFNIQKAGVVSFKTGSDAAIQMIAALYGPIFGQIKPEEVGSKARAMRITKDYAKRLDRKFSNLKPEGLSTLSTSYASHDFVIDLLDATMLFKDVRNGTKEEALLIDQVLFPSSELILKHLTLGPAEKERERNHDRTEKNTTRPKRVGKTPRNNGKNLKPTSP